LDVFIHPSFPFFAAGLPPVIFPNMEVIYPIKALCFYGKHNRKGQQFEIDERLSHNSISDNDRDRSRCLVRNILILPAQQIIVSFF
jgi:hypothetical protein